MSIELPGVTPIRKTQRDLSEDRVAGLFTIPRALPPFTADRFLKDFTFDIRRSMLNDPRISADLRLIAQKVMADGVMIRPAATDDREELAQEIADFCQCALANFKQSNTDDPLKKIGEAVVFESLAHGYKVTEQTFTYLEHGRYKGRIGLKSMRLLEHADVNFRVDRFWNVLGFEASNLSNQLLPVEKFFHFAPWQVNQDPRGMIWIRPAYNAWSFKQTSWQFYQKFLDRFAVASLHAALGATTQAGQEILYKDKAGNTATDPATGKPKKITLAEYVKTELLEYENCKVIVTPNGVTLTPIESKSEGGVFKETIKLVNQEMTLAILLQTRATSEAEHGSKADSATAENQLNDLVWSFKNDLAGAFRRQVLRVLVALNFGEDAVDLTPEISLGDSERKDWAEDADSASKLAPHVTDSQWDALTGQLGIPPVMKSERRPPRR